MGQRDWQALPLQTLKRSESISMNLLWLCFSLLSQLFRLISNHQTVIQITALRCLLCRLPLAMPIFWRVWRSLVWFRHSSWAVSATRSYSRSYILIFVLKLCNVDMCSSLNLLIPSFFGLPMQSLPSSLNSCHHALHRLQKYRWASGRIPEKFLPSIL